MKAKLMTALLAMAMMSAGVMAQDKAQAPQKQVPLRPQVVRTTVRPQQQPQKVTKKDVRKMQQKRQKMQPRKPQVVYRYVACCPCCGTPQQMQMQQDCSAHHHHGHHGHHHGHGHGHGHGPQHR